MKKLGIATLLGAFVISSLAMFATSAWAIPVFARKYNVACSLCHTIPPRLTLAGVAFKENGYEMPSAMPQSDRFGNALKDIDPTVEVPAGLPFALRSGLNVGISNSQAPSLPTASGSAAMSIGVREFGLLGAGNVGGIGFWFDAPFAGANGGGVGINDFVAQADWKSSDMFKVKVGKFEPANTINYGMGDQPFSLDPIQANPVANLSAGTGAFGAITLGGVEVRGTTDATNGLGFNYAVGYQFSTGTANNDPYAQMPVTPNAESDIYGALGYLFSSINTNLGASYMSVNNPGGAAGTGNTLLATATWNIGNPLQMIVAYNTTNNAAKINANGWVIQPEYVTDQWWFGGRYASLNNYDAFAALAPGTLASPFGQLVAQGGTSGIVSGINSSFWGVGVGYRFLQNITGSVRYLSATTSKAGASGLTGDNGVSLGLDMVL